jgi:PPM family protein phosphatase
MDTRMRVGSHTAAGRRSSNQDAVWVGRLADGRELMAVADGMGGHQGGETASRQALETLINGLQQGRSLSDAIADANHAVHHEARANSELTGMGTTLVAMLRSGDRYHIANVGDSRAYRIDATGIEQITRDHSFLAEALGAGQLSEDEARRSRWRNALTRAIGTEERVQVDVFGPFDIDAAHSILLCTDGLHGVVGDEDICRTVREADDVDTAAQRLVQRAFESGSKDNITVAIVRLGESTAVPKPPAPNGKQVTNGNGNGNGSSAAVRPNIVVRKPTSKPVQLIMSPERREKRTLFQRLFPFLS